MPQPAQVATNPPPAADSDSPVRDALGAIERAEQMQREMAQPRPAPDFESQIAQLPDDAKAWLRAHPDYWTDKQKNRQLTGLHGYLVDTRGLAPFSEQYFDRLESELGLRRDPIEPAGFQAAQDPEPRRAPIVQAPPRSMPISAPVSRAAPSISAGGAVPTSITLSPEERQMARLSYRDLPPEQAERLYSEMKRRLLVAKANGEHTQ
jgi:hypothetical protein